jgi:L-alanine-DL-glutamate epimerase-like enolase superfamily enzyme
MVDANWAWSVDESIHMGRMLQEEGVYWLEDPLATEDPAQLAQVAAALDIPVASGENFHTKYDFRRLIEHHSADIFNIDLQAVGGVTEWMKVAAMAQAWNIPVASHVFSAQSVHLAAAVPNCLFVEYMPWWDRIYTSGPELDGGYLKVPESPGLGIELDERAIAMYRVA